MLIALCYLGLGSNLGDRRKNIRSALERIGDLKDTRIIKLSRIIETDPVGGPRKQRKFLNAALKIQTRLTPVVLLRRLKGIERDLGRVSRRRLWPRPIDLDILLYENRTIRRKNLIVPHPRIFERRFVLEPLAELL